VGNQEEYLKEYKEESLKQLKPEHEDVVNNFLKENQKVHSSYMLTIARDGEHPVRSIYYYSNALDAVSSYNRYTDWGFAKEYLTVSLYGPGGNIAEKVLRRPSGGTQGDCTFVREDYIKAEKILLRYKEVMDLQDYSSLVKDFAGLFSRDNIRFDVSRFFKETGCEEVFE
jgi:hypothetical protein